MGPGRHLPESARKAVAQGRGWVGGTAGPKGQRQAVGGRLWAGRWWGWALTPVTAWDKRTHLEGGGRTMQPAWAAPWERGLQWPARVAEGG